MRNLLILSALVIVSNAFGQGRVNFQNSVARSPIRQGLTGANVSASDGIRVALYWAPLSAPDSFVQIGNMATVGVPVPGQFVGGVRTTGTATAPGEDAFFIVRAWELAYGATYEVAVAASAIGGRTAMTCSSAPFRLTTPGSELLPAAQLEGTSANPGFHGMDSFSCVPEPSAFVLVAIGLVPLFISGRRRRRPASL